MNTSGFGGAAAGSANVASERRYEYPSVHEIKVSREQIGPDSFGDFGTPQKAPMKLSTHFESLADHFDKMYGSAMYNLGRALMAESGQLVLDLEPHEDEPSEGQPRDYTKQLEFHKQEVADAPKRGMPEAQVNYHIGKVAVLEDLPRPPQGPPPEVKKCLHTECDCD